MWSRALTIKPRKSPKDAENTNGRSVSIFEYEDYIFGYREELPVIFCKDPPPVSRTQLPHNNDLLKGGSGGCGGLQYRLTLREVLRASVGVMGESSLGMTEKMVLLEGKVCAVKRFRKVKVRRREFGRRVEVFAQAGSHCKYIVPVRAYLLSKRIKFVVCDYYPMGSLADLLAGARNLGHTALGWDQRRTILLHVGKAIAFIHSQSSQQEKNMQMNIHGNIKASNVMINTDFTARLSDYGFAQLADRVEVSDTGLRNSPLPAERLYKETLTQKSDIYNFGIIMLDVLGGPKAPQNKKCVAEKLNDIKAGDFEFFEFYIGEKEKKLAVQFLEIAMACTNRSPEARPSIEHVLSCLGTFVIS